MVNFYRNNWYNLAGVACLALAFYMGFWGEGYTELQVILIYSFMALLAHQFEEYVLPGGAQVSLNVAFYGEKKDYDRFPGNKQSCMLVNTLSYPFYIVAIFYPEQIWLGLAVMFFGFMQFPGHAILMNLRGKTWYNPGLATTILLFLPLGIYYIWYVTSHGLVTGQDYLYATLAFIAAAVVIVALPVQLLKNRNSPYPMTREDMARFNMIEKYIAKGVLPSPN